MKKAKSGVRSNIIWSNIVKDTFLKDIQEDVMALRKNSIGFDVSSELNKTIIEHEVIEASLLFSDDPEVQLFLLTKWMEKKKLSFINSNVKSKQRSNNKKVSKSLTYRFIPQTSKEEVMCTLLVEYGILELDDTKRYYSFGSEFRMLHLRDPNPCCFLYYYSSDVYKSSYLFSRYKAPLEEVVSSTSVLIQDAAEELLTDDPDILKGFSLAGSYKPSRADFN